MYLIYKDSNNKIVKLRINSKVFISYYVLNGFIYLDFSKEMIIRGKESFYKWSFGKHWNGKY